MARAHMYRKSIYFVVFGRRDRTRSVYVLVYNNNVIVCIALFSALYSVLALVLKSLLVSDCLFLFCRMLEANPWPLLTHLSLNLFPWQLLKAINYKQLVSAAVLRAIFRYFTESFG